MDATIGVIGDLRLAVAKTTSQAITSPVNVVGRHRRIAMATGIRRRVHPQNMVVQRLPVLVVANMAEVARQCMLLAVAVVQEVQVLADTMVLVDTVVQADIWPVGPLVALKPTSQAQAIIAADPVPRHNSAWPIVDPTSDQALVLQVVLAVGVQASVVAVQALAALVVQVLAHLAPTAHVPMLALPIVAPAVVPKVAAPVAIAAQGVVLVLVVDRIVPPANRLATRTSSAVSIG